MSDRLPKRFWPIAVLVSVLHALLLCLPILCLHRGSLALTNLQIVAFLSVNTTWFLLETWVSRSGFQLPQKSHGPVWLPAFVGLSLLLTFWVSLTEAALSVPNHFGAMEAIGLLLMLAGVALRCLAICTLRQYFVNQVAILQGQKLVTDGIYGWLRHPSETATLTLAGGGVLVLHSEWGFFTGLLLLFPAILYRTRLEDAMLMEHYQTEFLSYRETVSAFLPKFSDLRIGRSKDRQTSA